MMMMKKVSRKDTLLNGQMILVHLSLSGYITEYVCEGRRGFSRELAVQTNDQLTQ